MYFYTSNILDVLIYLLLVECSVNGCSICFLSYVLLVLLGIMRFDYEILDSMGFK